ncbi:MAG: DUF2179 domain-containing protein [Actinobacteria bacterium]|nr:DUF2179 domain-containing protein [Actinomycetota bacterium]
MKLAWSILLIVSLRLVDVSLGTLRIILLSRRHRLLPAAIGFVEVFTWLVAATLVFSSLNSPPRMLAYAGGFALGTILGTLLESWLAVGTTMMRVVTPVTSPQVEGALRKAGFAVTMVNADGRDGEVRLAFTIIPRRRAREALRIVHSLDPAAFVTLQDIETVTPPERRAALPVK